MTIAQITSDALKCQTPKDFSKYLESYYFEIEQYFNSLTLSELDALKFDIEDLLYDLMDASLVTKSNPQIINAFLLLLANSFEQANLLGVITIIYDYLPESNTKKRLAAAKIYLKVNDISQDYHNSFDRVMPLLNVDEADEEDVLPNIRAVENYFMTAMHNFSRIKNSELVNSFKELFSQYKEQYNILNSQEIFTLVKQVTIENYDEFYKQFRLDKTLKIVDKACVVDSHAIVKENSEYSQQLYNLANRNFYAIRQFSLDYIQNIGDQYELYEKLNRGKKIIDDPRLLYQYMFSFGKKHKEKLDDAYKVIINKIKDEKINIIDWGCGQAFATMVLLNFARENNITLDIFNICLIEPSKITLERGLLHIDILKQKEYAIKAINSDIDCIKQSDLMFNNDYKTLHLFSNILDIDSFKLDNNLLQNISATFKNNNLFVCVSPKINDRRNNRLDLFYNYFNENFNTHLISARNSDINGHKRYEKIFEVQYVEEKVIEEKRQEIAVIQKDYNLDVIQELNNYHKYVVPILNMQILEDSINSDPEYAIFKIRKVAEVITSKIYSQYESNDAKISFNDKIRYLSYEKKVFDKTITNYVQTLRTIGNRGVHEDGREISKLKLDAHLMIIALISFLNEVVDKKLI